MTTHLSVGYGTTRRRRLVLLSIYGAMLLPAGCCLGALLSLITTNLFVRSQAENPAWSVACGLLVALPLGAFPVLMMVRITRLAAWLEGTRLTVRQFRTRSVDLRTARSVRLDTILERGPANSAVRSPVMTVVGPEGSVKLMLRGRDGALLPAPEMIALADALSTTACPGAHESATWLRTMATDPRTILM
ncbi:hypothetical protein GCM10009682_21150 [Luedemannella flava]|uniref:Uncharacterized protein n=1 Tax=Luedemannella flava TaxID=349316 RepID=A0ABN2LU26_9ACTN